MASNVAKCANSLRNPKKLKFSEMYQFIEKYEKNSRLTNFQILEILKKVPKVTKCADSLRNTEESEFSKFEKF